MKPIIITEGDPTGISLELLDKSISILQSYSNKCPIIFVSSQDQIVPKAYQISTSINDPTEISKKGLYLYRTTFKSKQKLKLSKPSKYSGLCSIHSLKNGISIQKKMNGNMITLPLSKEWVIRSGENSFTGHTEELAFSYKKETFMLMYGQNMKVIPLTTHIPLIKVPEILVNLKVLALVNAIKSSILIKDNPRIALCGVNPHAGENGKIGTEELSILKPILNVFRKQGLSIQGPIPGDSVFIKENLKKFDLILACYHDQGLIPFKSMEGKFGINVTLGLDFVRVSPDHGTAFDIAGKGVCDPESFLQCLKLLKRL